MKYLKLYESFKVELSNLSTEYHDTQKSQEKQLRDLLDKYDDIVSKYKTIIDEVSIPLKDEFASFKVDTIEPERIKEVIRGGGDGSKATLPIFSLKFQISNNNDISELNYIMDEFKSNLLYYKKDLSDFIIKYHIRGEREGQFKLIGKDGQTVSSITGNSVSSTIEEFINSFPKFFNEYNCAKVHCGITFRIMD